MNPQRVLIYLRKHPGSTCGEIALKLEEKAALVSLALRELRAAGKLTSEGKTRGTRWTIAAGQ
jgi:hypothetical protein